MIDLEVERLRRLRGSALRVRAVARALGAKKWTLDDPLLNRGACTAWRVARAVSGRLRAHPYASFQKDASLVQLIGNGIVAKATAAGASSRLRALQDFEMQLKAFARELDDVRALTWAYELSDSFGRSQREIRALVDALECETHVDMVDTPPVVVRAHEPQRRLAPIAPDTSGRAAAAGGDWPYLAF